MKKTYMIPETCVQQLELQQMMAGSDRINISSNSFDENTEEVGANSGGGFWDDDED